MNECRECGDYFPRAEMIECEVCGSDICFHCHTAHYLEHEHEEEEGRGEAFYYPDDLDDHEML